ncbi:MAG: hypothetical protein LQ339_007397 [Xanthoria mediterranea]|nr:MAG: hypothetical protein LQ339_007397 [Xanthoria mediterranea]
MALAYPEGESFFVRTKLESSEYHANDVKDFYSHMMIEYVWNREALHGGYSHGGHQHPRSGYRIVRGSWWNTDYGNWTALPFSYGPDANSITRRVEHRLCTNGNAFRDRQKGGSYQCLAFIRAIYLPVAYSVSKDHPELCSFVQMNFALSRTVKFWHGEGRFDDVKTDQVLGLQPDVKRTLAVDVTGLIQLLTLPRQLRRDNCYNLKLLQLHPATSMPMDDLWISKYYAHKTDISWVTVAKGNYGLDLTWQPPQKSTWEETFIKNTLTVAAGFVPAVGPIVQIMFSVGWTLISEEDPQAALRLLQDLCPAVDLSEHIVDELKKAAAESREFLPDGWKELNLQTQRHAVEAKTTPKPIEPMDAMLPMSLQKQVLDATGNSPDEDTAPDESEDGGETVADTPAGELMESGQKIVRLR